MSYYFCDACRYCFSLLRNYLTAAQTAVHRPIKRNQQSGRQITMK